MIKYNPQNDVSCVDCYKYSTWKMLALWLYIQSGLSCRKHQHREYTYKTVQIIYTATKLTPSMYCIYNS